MRNHPECSNENRDFDRYLEFMFGQIKELLTNYGKLDLMWFDFSYGNMKCDKWKAQELISMVRSIHLADHDNRLEAVLRTPVLFLLQILPNIPAISHLRSR